MKVLEKIQPILAQLTRDQLVSLAKLCLELAEVENDLNELFMNPSFINLLEKDLQDLGDEAKLIPFTLDSLKSDIRDQKHGS